MRKYDRTTESFTQADVLIFMDKYRDTWFTTEQVREALGAKTREKISKFLRKLVGKKNKKGEYSGFVEKKRVRGTNELLYKIREGKWK